MNILLLLVAVALGLGLTRRLPAQWLSPLLFGLALLVTGLFFVSHQGF